MTLVHTECPKKARFYNRHAHDEIVVIDAKLKTTDFAVTEKIWWSPQMLQHETSYFLTPIHESADLLPNISIIIHQIECYKVSYNINMTTNPSPHKNEVIKSSVIIIGC